MGKALYIEAAAGIAGDMLVAALLDLGADREKLVKVLDSLPLDGYEIEISQVKKAGLACCDFHVILREENHDHDMAYLHGERSPGADLHAAAEHAGQAHEHHHSHEHDHDHEHHQSHEHDHDHEHHYGHVHRGLREVTAILEGAALTDGARSLAKKMFDILAEAEAKAHGVPREEVHFHEVGAVDSIVDIVAIAVCIDDLGIRRAFVPSLSEGSGTVRCQHGILPVPVPAVANIVERYQIPMRPLGVDGEFVTPTGAAAAAALRTDAALPASYCVEKIGMGAGKREYAVASILRVMLISLDEEKRETEDQVVCLETNIDDGTGEMLGSAMETLLAAGARDVFFTPIYMKKNRPAVKLTVLCTPPQTAEMERILFACTTTIGVRRRSEQRTVLARREEARETPLGEILFKVCRLPGGTERAYPEYESVRAAAEQAGIVFEEAYRRILSGME